MYQFFTKFKYPYSKSYISFKNSRRGDIDNTAIYVPVDILPRHFFVINEKISETKRLENI